MQQRSVTNKLPSIFWSQSTHIGPGYKNWMPPVSWVDYYPWTGMVAVTVLSVISFSKFQSLCFSKWKVRVDTEHRNFCCVVYILILWITKWKLYSHIWKSYLHSFGLWSLRAFLRNRNFCLPPLFTSESSCSSEKEIAKIWDVFLFCFQILF